MSSFFSHSSEIDLNNTKCERIKKVIDSYLAKNPKLSLQSLENRTGLPITTLRRMTSPQSNPNPENIVKLFLALGFDKDLEEYLAAFHPELASLVKTKSHNKDYKFVSEEIAALFLEEPSFTIMNLACTTNGTSENEVKELVGQIGLAKLNELIEKEVLGINDFGRVVGKLDNYKLGLSDVKREIELSLKYYRLNEAGSENNFINYQTESLNVEGLKALKELEKKQAIERREMIFNNKKLQGELAVFTATISSTYLPYSSTSEVLQ